MKLSLHLKNTRTADQWFWPVLLIFATFWTIAPAFVISNFRPDVMEMILTGQNWVLATEKHGSFTCWLLEIVYVLTGRATWSPYFTSQLCVILSLLAIYGTAKEYLPAPQAVLAPFCMLAYYFFHFESTLYNNNTTLILFWAVSVFFCLKALTAGRIRWWILTGVSIGLGLYCKMTIIFLVITILDLMTFDRRARKFWHTPGPWLTTATAFLIYLPLFFWNLQHDFANFTYAIGSATYDPFPTRFCHVIAPLHFLAEQMLYVVPISIPLIPLTVAFFLRRNDSGKAIMKRRRFTNLKERYLLFIFLVPLIIQILFAVKSGGPTRGALGCHLWLFWPTLILTMLSPDPNDGAIEEDPSVTQSFRTAFRLSLTVPAVIGVIFIIGIWIAPAVEGHASRYHFPGKALGETVTRLWRERYRTPLPFVIGDEWLTQNVSVYGADRARLWYPLWATEEEFRQKGGVLLWEEGNEESLGRKREAEERFPYNGEIITLTFRQQTPFNVAPARVSLGFYPPAPTEASDVTAP